MGERNESMARSQSSGHSGLSGRRAQKQQSSGVFIFVAFAVCAAIFLLSQAPSPTSPPAVDPSAQTAADLATQSRRAEAEAAETAAADDAAAKLKELEAAAAASERAAAEAAKQAEAKVAKKGAEKAASEEAAGKEKAKAAEEAAGKEKVKAAEKAAALEATVEAAAEAKKLLDEAVADAAAMEAQITRQNEEAESAKLRTEAEAATLREKQQAEKGTAADQKKQKITWLMSVAAAVTLIAMVFLFRSKEPSDEDIRATARALYEAADINEDGHLSHKELINYIEDDKNAENGELREALEARNPGFSKRVHLFFKNMDGNSDGVITLQEFEDYYFKQIKQIKAGGMMTVPHGGNTGDNKKRDNKKKKRH